MATMPIQGNDTIATKGNWFIDAMRPMTMWTMRTLNNGVMYFTAIRDTPQYAHSRISSMIEKLPMILAMGVSSILVGISTYNTFPTIGAANNPISLEWLRLVAAIAGGLTFDVLLTSTVFARRKSGFSYLTILAALIAGLVIALDLYLSLHQQWVHSVFIVMTVLYSLHIATTRGKPVQLLEQQIIALEQELNKTLEQLAQERLDSRLIEHDQEQTIRTLETQNATLSSVLEQLNAPKPVVATDKEYHCKKCGHALDDTGRKGAGKQLASSRWGCNYCK